MWFESRSLSRKHVFCTWDSSQSKFDCGCLVISDDARKYFFAILAFVSQSCSSSCYSWHRSFKTTSDQYICKSAAPSWLWHSGAVLHGITPVFSCKLDLDCSSDNILLFRDWFLRIFSAMDRGREEFWLVEGFCWLTAWFEAECHINCPTRRHRPEQKHTETYITALDVGGLDYRWIWC